MRWRRRRQAEWFCPAYGSRPAPHNHCWRSDAWPVRCPCDRFLGKQFSCPPVCQIYSSKGLPAMCSSQRHSGKDRRNLLVSCVGRRIYFTRPSATTHRGFAPCRLSHQRSSWGCSALCCQRPRGFYSFAPPAACICLLPLVNPHPAARTGCCAAGCRCLRRCFSTPS